MIRVCHMTSAHDPEDVRIFHKECVSLANVGYEVYLVERGDSYDKNGVHIVGVGYPTGGRLSRMFSFSKKVYHTALALDADVYHLHDPELLPYGLKLKKKGKKVIFDSHEDTCGSILEKAWIPAAIRKGVFCAFSLVEKYVCRKLDAVVTVTPHIVEHFQKINSKTVQIANFPMLKEKVQCPHFQNKTLMFAGGINRDWHHQETLAAMEQLPDCRYCLCGSGSDDYMQSLRVLPAWEQTDYHGKVPHGQIAALMADSYVGMALDTYCRNSDGKNGTIGNTKIFEEMMAGLPVVCTNFVRWREFVDRYQCGICVEPDDIDEIVKALRYLLDHPEEAKRMGENGRRAVEKEFNWGEEEKKLLVLYEEVINDK